MELACSNGNEFWLMFIDIIIPVDHNGKTLMSALSSSTCSIVQRLHGFKADPSGAMSCSGFLMRQALFKNLIAKATKEALFKILTAKATKAREIFYLEKKNK